jgi:hypothetical protein
VRDFGPQISRRYFPNSADRLGTEGNQFLFTRDLPLGIMPNRINRDAQFRVILEPEDEEVTGGLISMLDVGHFTRQDLTEATVEFVERVAELIGYRGEVLLELVGGGPGAFPKLSPLPPGPVMRAPGGFYQLIPKADRTELKSGAAVRIPSTKLWQVKLPRELGGVRGHRRMLAALGERSSPAPNFLFRTPDMGRSAGYDFAAHRRACEVGIERATRHWGTIPSRFRVDGTTEYFLFSRRLAFAHAQAKLRDHILHELNQLLRRLQIEHRIRTEGLKSPTEIEKTLLRLRAGELTISEAMEIDDA